MSESVHDELLRISDELDRSGHYGASQAMIRGAREINRLSEQNKLLRSAVWTAQNEYAHANPHSPFVAVLEQTKAAELLK